MTKIVDHRSEVLAALAEVQASIAKASELLSPLASTVATGACSALNHASGILKANAIWVEAQGDGYVS